LKIIVPLSFHHLFHFICNQCFFSPAILISFAISWSSTRLHWEQKQSDGLRTLLQRGHFSSVTWRLPSVLRLYRSKILLFISSSVKLAYILSICILPLDQPALCFTSCSFRPSSIQLVIALCLKEWGLTRFLIPASLPMFWIVTQMVL